ncbi:MAG: GNAT family N-acetyltransferase [Phycisphaerales bacterium JB060]
MDQTNPVPRNPATQPKAGRPVEVFAGDTPGARLDTDRLILRPATPADAGAFEAAIDALIASGDGNSGVNLPGEQARQIVKRQLDLTAKGLRTGGALRRVIFDREDSGQILGACNLISIERGLEWYAELAFWLTPAARGRGIAREACAAVAHHAMADLPAGLGCTSVRAYVQPTNARAQSLLASLDFAHQPHTREHKDTGGQHHPHELWLKGLA